MDERAHLITKEIPHIRRYARKLETDPHAAEDLTQDALERALRKRHLWTRRGSMRSWLYRLMFNVFMNRRSQRAKEHAEIALEQAPTLSEPPPQEQALLCRDIVAAVHGLPAEQYAAVTMASEEVSYDQAARAAGVPIGTFRSRLSRGRERRGAVVRPKVCCVDR